MNTSPAEFDELVPLPLSQTFHFEAPGGTMGSRRKWGRTGWAEVGKGLKQRREEGEGVDCTFGCNGRVM